MNDIEKAVLQRLTEITSAEAAVEAVQKMWVAVPMIALVNAGSDPQELHRTMRAEEEQNRHVWMEIDERIVAKTFCHEIVIRGE